MHFGLEKYYTLKQKKLTLKAEEHSNLKRLYSTWTGRWKNKKCKISFDLLKVKFAISSFWKCAFLGKKCLAIHRIVQSSLIEGWFFKNVNTVVYLKLWKFMLTKPEVQFDLRKVYFTEAEISRMRSALWSFDLQKYFTLNQKENYILNQEE